MECSLNNENYVDVYRVEKRGRGPFGEGGWNASSCMDSSLPTPQYDSGLPELDFSEITRYRFGAQTSQSLKQWIFDPSGLTKRGYKVSLYKAKKKYVHSSEIQSMFIKRHAKKVMEWDVEKFCRDI